MLTKLIEDESTANAPVDEWECQQCHTPIGWTLLNERSIHFVECWYVTGLDPFDERLPKWCDDCVVPSPIPFHKVSHQ